MITPKTITIGKTTYKVRTMEIAEAATLYVLEFGKQVKSLFYSPSLETWMMYSGPQGMPKVVPVVLNY